MPDTLVQAVIQTVTEIAAIPGFWWLFATMTVAGIVRGFTGFGTGLVFVPIAGLFLPPAEVVGVIATTGLFSTFVLLPRAWRQADRRQVGVLIVAAFVTIPLGVVLMQALDALTVRWCVSFIAGGTLVALVSGWRFSRKVRGAGLLLIGAAAGVIGGMTGITGPVIILFYLAGRAAAQSVRANTILFLAAMDLAIVISLLWGGITEWSTVWLALVLAAPYFCTTLIGQALFDPSRETVYRYLAYSLIGLSVISGLPLWS